MNKFILILSDKTLDLLDDIYAQALVVLNPTSHKLHRLLPHILLFETQLELDAASRIVIDGLKRHEPILVFQIHDDFRGVLRGDKMDGLKDFFEQPR